jgi:ribosome maturation factor RimP
LLEIAELNDDQPIHTGLEARIADIIAPRLEAQGFELVRVQVMGKETPTVQVMADRADETPLTLEDCEQISHFLSAVLDVEDPISSAWTLEISSAGIDRPLTRTKDWTRHAGFNAKVELKFPDKNGRKRYTGTIIEANAEEARLKIETGDIVAIDRNAIAKAKLVLTDALIAFTTKQTIPN